MQRTQLVQCVNNNHGPSLQDEMADWIEAYTKAMQLNIWAHSAVQSSQFNEETKEWAVTVSRPGGDTVTLRPKHLVLSTGLFGDPRTPAFEGADTFQGLQYHATCHRSDSRDFRGRKCVVLGSNTSGHDVCRDLWEKGADVTMVQRSATLVIRTETLNALYVDPLYSEGCGFTQQQADLLMVSTPFRLLAPFQITMAEAARKRDADLHDALRKVGSVVID
jgi:putative flavoprotein involved in K+ transport